MGNISYPRQHRISPDWLLVPTHDGQGQMLHPLVDALLVRWNLGYNPNHPIFGETYHTRCIRRPLHTLFFVGNHNPLIIHSYAQQINEATTFPTCFRGSKVEVASCKPVKRVLVGIRYPWLADKTNKIKELSIGQNQALINATSLPHFQNKILKLKF